MKPHIRNAAEGDMDFLIAGLEANRRIEGRAPEAVPLVTSAMSSA